MITTAVMHHYRRYRRHQLATYGNSGLYVDGVDQRQFTGGGAAYGYHAYAAWLSAKRTIHFRKNLRAMLQARQKGGDA